MHQQLAKRILLLTLVNSILSSLLYSNLAIADEIRIGIRANRGAELALKRWQATADYLNKKIPGYRFVLVPFEINSLLNQAVSRDEFHFVLTNPASHVEQNIRYGVTPLATLVNKRKGKPYSQFGSVIFTRADRNDISSFQDLKGKKFMGADELGFGGWRVAYKEILEKGVDPYKDFSLLSFAGGIQQNVVFAVRDGKVDAGSVRTDMLERMANRKEIDLDSFKVLEAKKTPGFAFYHSSRLYPEWPFAKLTHTSDKLAELVTTALLEISPDSQAAVSGKYIGWSKPLDYEPVNTLLKDLGVGPYKISDSIKFSTFIRTYWKTGLIMLLILLTAIFIAWWMILSNRKLKNLTEKLEDYRKHLEEKVQTRTADLIASNNELESYSHSIAHDLRTPLRSVVGFSQILKKEASEKLNEEELDAIDRIIKSGNHMAEVINDILDLSRITRDTLKKDTLDLSAICHELADNYNKQYAERNINWVIEEDVSCQGDKVQIYSLLQNLIENACKFTRDTVQPTIEFGQKMLDGLAVYFVKDNGVGFDMQYSEKIFTPFNRLYRNEYDGTGVGLSIVKRVIERHGGKIWVEAQAGVGATFYFILSTHKPDD